MATNIGCAAPDATAPLAPPSFDRPPAGPQDVRRDTKRYGVCPAGIHRARNESDGLREEETT